MDNLLHLIGLCKRAGQLESGDEPVGAACRAKASAANSPAGPSPQTTGRPGSFSAPWVRVNCGSARKATQGEEPANAGSSPSSFSVTAMV